VERWRLFTENGGYCAIDAPSLTDAKASAEDWIFNGEYGQVTETTLLRYWLYCVDSDVAYHQHVTLERG